MKYLTHADYCRAKNHAGYTHLDKVIPIEKRKLFPFSYHTNFHLSVMRKSGQKAIASLTCAHCEVELSKWGNGSYYTGYIVFDSPSEFYACCYRCRPEGCMDYHDQVHGHRHPMEVMKNGKVFDWVTKEHLAAYCYFVRTNAYELWNYPKGFKSVKLAKNVINPSWGGGSCYIDGRGFYEQNGFSIKIMDRDFKEKWRISPNQVLQLVNDIIRHNVMGNFQHEPDVVKPGIQLTLF